MRAHWLHPGILATKLARGEVSNSEVAHFITGNFLFGTIVYYGAFTWSTPPWTALSLWECLIDIVVIVFGMIRCFEAAGGERNSAFAAQFACLSFPISLWVMVVTWSVFWGGAWLAGVDMMQVSADSYRFAKSLGSFGGDLKWVWTVIAVLGSQIVFFVWMRSALVRAQVSASSSLPQP